MKPDQLPEVRAIAYRMLANLRTKIGDDGFLKQIAAPRSLAVCHEAGHAIMFTVDGVPVESIKVFLSPDPRTPGDHWHGFTAVEGSPPFSIRRDDPPEKLRQEIRYQIAGYAGELELYEGTVPLTSSIDERALGVYVLEMCPRLIPSDRKRVNPKKASERTLDDIVEECRKIIRPQAAAGRAIITAMADKDCLDGAELRAILDPINR